MKSINIRNIKRQINNDKLEEIASRAFDDEQITVSILCLCFNHAPYLRRCIDNFLNQKVNFNVEILIHDDASTDGSIEILKEYEHKYPKVIKVIYEKENQYSKGINIENTILSKYVQGKYVAICEGDDFWNNPFKLALQVQCFEQFPDISFVVHKVLNQNLSGQKIGFIPKKINHSTIFDRVEIVPRIIKSYTFHTTSYLFKSSDFKHYCDNLPKFAKHLKVGDYGLQLYFSNLGKTIYLDEEMSVHVDNVPGSWTEKSRKATIEQSSSERNNIIESLELFDEFTFQEFHKSYQEKYIKARMHELYALGKYAEIIEDRNFRRALFRYDPKSCIAIYLMVKHPALYRRLKTWKRKAN